MILIFYGDMRRVFSIFLPHGIQGNAHFYDRDSEFGTAKNGNVCVGFNM